jgi:pSer/pThr/pTyr-binding forkhead associated (FHA) protein
MTAIVVLILRILMAAALYGFVVWVVLTLWRDLQQQARLLSGRTIPTLTLAAPHLNPPLSHQVSTQEVIVGRDPGCDLLVTNDTVSARHAKISYHHKQWWVEDLRSTNGTYLNDEGVQTATVIISGDDLRLGEVEFQIQIEKG